MIKVFLPANNQAERQYAAEVLLVEWLGLSVQFQFGETSFAADITLDNGNRLLLEDHFFSILPTPLSYLSREKIPQKILSVARTSNPFLPEEDLPILFGNDRLDISLTEITCGIDIIAAAFFMLTRWEEYVLPDRDMHERFPAKASLASKWNFMHRPIVNEMTEMLWEMLVHLGINQPRKQQKFEVMLTHDVDMPLLWRSSFSFLKKLGGDLLKRHDLREAAFSVKSFVQTRFLGGKDPYDTFDYLMDCADRKGLKSYFFFLCGGNSHYDESMPLDTPFMRRLLEKIQERGHVIGIHPSYNTLNNSDLLQQENEKLKKTTGFPVHGGRQHFLRFEAPATWQMYEDSGMKWDSTLYYPEQTGFRCGTCNSFPVFNFLTRKQLLLREIPMTAMEVTWTTYWQATPAKMLEEMNALMETVHKYRGTFVLLWHNSSLNTPKWQAYTPVFEQLLEKHLE